MTGQAHGVGGPRPLDQHGSVLAPLVTQVNTVMGPALEGICADLVQAVDVAMPQIYRSLLDMAAGQYTGIDVPRRGA